MPKQTKNIEKFTGGMITSIDQKDIGDEYAVFCNNIRRDKMGRCVGVPIQTSIISNSGSSFGDRGWINAGSEYDFIYGSGGNTYAIKDFYGTPASSVLFSQTATSIIAHNKEVHCGCGTSNIPQWAGYISYGQFGGSVPTGLQVFNSPCSQIENESSPTTGNVARGSVTWTPTPYDSGSFYQTGHVYHWKFSIIYDGYQESILSEDFTESVPSGQSVGHITYQLKFYGYASWTNKRISGVNVYRAIDQGAYTQCQFINIADLTYTGSLSNGTWSISGSDYVYEFQDDGWNLNGASYTANSGLSDVSDSSTINYTLGAELNGSLYVGNCYNANIPDASYYIFKSQDGFFDTFDIANNNLRLPDIPKAFAAFQGRLYAFTTNRIYIINPQGFYVENVYEGAGCYSQQSVLATQIGLFFADKNNCYMYNGSSYLPIPIGDPVKTSNPVMSIFGWQGMDFTNSPVICYDAILDEILFVSSENLSVNHRVDAFAYNVESKRWDYYQNLCATLSSYMAFTGKSGESYSVGVTGLSAHAIYNNFNGTTNRTWSYITKEYVLDEPSQPKKYYDLYINKYDVSYAITPTYSVDSGSTWKSLTSTTHIQNSGVWEKANTIMFKFSGVTGTNRLDSASFLYRSMAGVR